ncbi:hypothetical protein NXY00_17520 [Bacteroides sp. BFG-551]|nr:hypothetical protein [Bacteroides sp. BFG-551]
MNGATKDFILLCVVAYLIWILLVTLWGRFTTWWKIRFSKKHKWYNSKKSSHRVLTTDRIVGKSKFNLQAEQAKQRERKLQQEEQERLKLAEKDETRIKTIAAEMAREMVQEYKAEMQLQQPTPPEEPPKRFPKVIPVEELDAVFSNEEVLPDYSVPDRMMVTDSATTISELENVVEVLKNRESTTVEQQQEAVKVIAKIDNTLLLEQMLYQIDGATKYASELIEKHYTEQLTPHSKPRIEGFDMEKYLNY